MIDIEEQNQMYLDELIHMDKPEEFGPSFIQRNLFIGYNRAIDILDLGVNNGVLERATVPYRYRVIEPCRVRTADSDMNETYTTQPGESVMGIALRQLGNERRWGEIRFLNADRFPNIVPNSYYPVGTVLKMPPKEGWNSDKPIECVPSTTITYKY